MRFYALPPDRRFDFVDTGEGTEQVLTLLTGGQSLADADLERAPMFARQIEQWALLSMLSYPMGMRVDAWLHAEYPALRLGRETVRLLAACCIAHSTDRTDYLLKTGQPICSRHIRSLFFPFRHKALKMTTCSHKELCHGNFANS